MPLYILLQDLKWNPHIHCLIPELIYSLKKDKIKTFQFELIRLIQEAGGLKKPEERNRLYKEHPKGFYVYAKFKSTDNDSNDASSNKNSKDIQGCVNYFIRYAGRPAMAENRITEYNKGSNTVSWFYNDHKDEKRYDVTDNVIDSFNRDPIQCKCGAIMQYTYTYNPFKDKRNDRTYRKRCIDGMMRMYKRRI